MIVESVLNGNLGLQQHETGKGQRRPTWTLALAQGRSQRGRARWRTWPGCAAARPRRQP